MLPPLEAYLNLHRHTSTSTDILPPLGWLTLACLFVRVLCVYACVLQVELVFRYVFLAQVGSLPAVFDAALLAPVCFPPPSLPSALWMNVSI